MVTLLAFSSLRMGCDSVELTSPGGILIKEPVSQCVVKIAGEPAVWRA